MRADHIYYLSQPMQLEVQLETDFYVIAFDKCRYVYRMLKRPNNLTPTGLCEILKFMTANHPTVVCSLGGRYGRFAMVL